MYYVKKNFLVLQAILFIVILLLPLFHNGSCSKQLTPSSNMFEGLPIAFFFSCYIPSASRVDILLYSLRSYKSIGVVWSEAYIFLDLEVEAQVRKGEIETAVYELFPSPHTRVVLSWSRPLTQEEWKGPLELIAGRGGHGTHKLVFFFQNDDHPFVDFNSDVLREGLSLMVADPAPFVSLFLSHWPEIVRMSGKLRTQEIAGKSYVRFEGTLLDGFQVLKSEYMWFIFQQLDWKGKQIKRTDGLIMQSTLIDLRPLETALYTTMSMQSIYVPLREQCRHFGGYVHVGMGEQWPSMSLDVEPTVYTTNYSSGSHLLSTFLARHQGAWTMHPPNTFEIPQEWLKTILRLYGFEVPPIVLLGSQDWP